MEAHTNAQYIYHSNNLNFRGLENFLIIEIWRHKHESHYVFWFFFI